MIRMLPKVQLSKVVTPQSVLVLVSLLAFQLASAPELFAGGAKPFADASTAAVADLIEVDNRLVRVLALSELCRRGTVESIAAVEDGLRHADHWTSFSAIRLLHEIDNATLRAGVRRSLVDAVVALLQERRSPLLAEEARRFLSRCFSQPGARPKSLRAWRAWWERNRDSFEEPLAPVDEEAETSPADGQGVEREEPKGGTGVAPEKKQTPSAEQLSRLLGESYRLAYGLDFVIAIDRTSSMKDVIAEVKSGSRRLVRAIEVLIPKSHIGLVTYDDAVRTSFALTEDRRSFLQRLQRMKLTSGGAADLPEGVDKALENALGFEFRDAVGKVVLVIGDAPAHREDLEATWRLAQGALRRGIQVSAIRRNPANTHWPGNVPTDFFERLVEAGGGTVHRLSTNDQVVRSMFIQVLGADFAARISPVIDGVLDLVDEKKSKTQ